MRVSLASPTKFHVFDLAIELQRAGYLHNIYTVYPRCRMPASLQDHTVSCPWLLPLWRVGHAGWLAAAVFDRWLTAVLRPCDVFHCLSGFGTYASARAKALGATTVCDRGSTHVLHQIAVLKAEYARLGGCFPRYSHRLVTRELRHYWQADCVTTPSRQSAETFSRYGYSPAILPYGVDLTHWRPLEREDSIFRILFVGAFSVRKGIPRLVDALRRVTLPQWEAWIVGTRQTETETLLRHLPPQSHVFGPVSQQRLPWYYSQADLLVLPSIEEGLPLVLLQALACGLPVLASKETGVADLPALPQSLIGEDLARDIEEWYRHPTLLKDARSLLADKRAWLSSSRYGRAVMQCYARAHYSTPPHLAA